MEIRIPKTDSIEELAEFWDTHDLTDFENELEEVDSPVFVRRKSISAVKIHLQFQEMEILQKLAAAIGE